MRTNVNRVPWPGLAALWLVGTVAGISQGAPTPGRAIYTLTAGAGLTGGGGGPTATIGIADGGVTNTMLANGAVGSTQLANGAVGSTQLASGAVGTGQLADGSVTLGKLSSSVQASLSYPAFAVTHQTFSTTPPTVPNNSSNVTLSDLTTTVTNTASVNRPLRVVAAIPVNSGVTGGAAFAELIMDGDTSTPIVYAIVTPVTGWSTLTVHRVLSLSPGSHTFSVRVRSSVALQVGGAGFSYMDTELQ